VVAFGRGSQITAALLVSPRERQAFHNILIWLGNFLDLANCLIEERQLRNNITGVGSRLIGSPKGLTHVAF